MNQPDPVSHFFSVDVEEHFQVVALEPWAPRSSWDSHPSRVARNVDRLLELLARHNAHGTFFILGWVARKDPGLIRRIAAGGHEILRDIFVRIKAIEALGRLRAVESMLHCSTIGT